MRIALFSDIHANLPALEAMFTDLNKRQVDAIYCLGDLVGYNVWPNEVIELIRSQKIPVLAGNHDAKVGALEAKEAIETLGKNYAYHLINDVNRKYLRDLPAHIRLAYKTADEKFDVLMVHGSTRRNDEYVLVDTPEEDVLAMMTESNASILCVAHSHKPYHRVLKSTGVNYLHVINTGSVGKPKDGNPQGCYVLLELTATTSMLSPETLNVDFVRFDYDVQAAANAVENSPLPNEFADMLRKAY
ncbi:MULTISPECIES: metallophosphoesterase family protein [Olivibacter]|jgi:predicted phosphodiesterase|uniref:Metallophosphoesterase family protein n=1 Tax=Olivibacter jilunii TaxID=985016 RepID=A0ABW6B3B6_9SPHI|nr:metallophosphoesterase family protein [Pseudosphingobacterium sp.]